MFRGIFEGMNDPILLIRDGQFVECNTATLKLLGYPSKAAFINKRPSEISPAVQPDGRPSEDKAAEMIATALQAGFHRFEWSHLRADGTSIPVEVSLTPITVGGELILHTLWRDITERKRAEEALRRSETKLRAIYDSTIDAVLLLDENGFFDCNKSALEIFGCKTREELCSKHPADLSPPVQPNNESSLSLADRMIAVAMANGRHHFEWMHRRVDDGRVYPAEVYLSAMELDGRKVIQAVVRDITERKSAEQALADRSRELEILNRELANSNASLAAAHEDLKQLAMRDPLTGAWNRRRLEEIVRQEMLRKERYGHPVSLIFIDLDHFKNINDTHGHAVGDDVLRQFCAIARQGMRATDVLGRWGGEEFVIALPNSGLVIANLLAERIRTAMMAYTFPQVGDATASFGVAECRTGETWEEWLARADSALYAAKQAGRNRVISDSSAEREADVAELIDHTFLRLVWRGAYESGQLNLDAQHKGLFEHANALLSAVIGDRPKDEIVPLIDALLADLLAHFADEEMVFRAAGYPEADHHVELHRDLVAQAKEMGNNFTSGRLEVGSLFNFLAYDVVSKHMLSEDRKFFPYLRLTEPVQP